MASNARGLHVSPGIYTREIDIQYAIKSLGITSLGVVGETLRGPAFQAMNVSNWREYEDVFGGTSPEKYKGSQYPKYELPYIAKSYLTESERLTVVRVLGLSGYNAGPAWLVTASNGGTSGADKKQAVAVIRSRGTYHPYDPNDNATGCTCETTKYDTLRYYVGEKKASPSDECVKYGFNENALKIEPYRPVFSDGNECEGYDIKGADPSWYVSQTNRGRFKLVGVTGTQSEADINRIYALAENDKAAAMAEGYFEFPVSLNPYDKEYILNVLGTKAYDGDTPIYVESLYDVALEQAIASYDVNQIDDTLQFYDGFNTADYCGHEPVYGIVEKPQSSLSRKYVGRRYLADAAAVDEQVRCVCYNYETGRPYTVKEIVNGDVAGVTNTTKVPSNIKTPEAKAAWSATTVSEVEMKAGQIYTVRQYTTQDGKRHYYYTFYSKESIDNVFNSQSGGENTPELVNYYGNLLGGGMGYSSEQRSTLVLNNSDGLYYKYDANSPSRVVYVELDMNDYKSSFRYASTPWIVSNLKGDYEHIELTKLFRFHTISDGDNANYEVKVSIENIRPDDGTFDVVVRDINDVDESIVALERFGRCSMTPGDSNYIAYKIGSFDGVYESKSKYITVEVADSTAAKTSVPAGFVGYPIPKYDGTPISGGAKGDVTFPTLQYNRFFDEEVKNRKQYFGLSSWVGVDIDNFTFKGNKTYTDDPRFLSHGFHLDSRLDKDNGANATVTVDGESGYEFECVSTNSRTQILDQPPIIGKETDMYGSIYEYVNLRKFTVFFYGGFDGWDVYRDQRTNTDSFKMSQYRGYINQNSGEGYSFNRIQNPEVIGLNQNGITSDWYAYLAGIRQFANPESTDINVFATPGIDYVNNKLLVEEAIEMVEEERADSIYVVTTPDKPSGAGDFIDEMYTPEEAVANLEDTEIDSNYTCTYYPWVKYLDQENSQYIYLPATKDAVRNFAQTDNTKWPWYAPAGIGRGQVDCVRARFITKIADEDTLYEGRINPIKTFAQDGPKLWGQKNLQVNESHLNRINVRRLMLRMRKLIAISCIGLIFEPNDDTARQSFISTVAPILDNIRSNRGISDYKIEVDDSIEARERRELVAKIFVKPIGALEYISIDFILTPEGIDFADI